MRPFLKSLLQQNPATAPVNTLPYRQVATFASHNNGTTGKVTLLKAPISGNKLIMAITADNNITLPTGWANDIEANVNADSIIASKTSDGTESVIEIVTAGSGPIVIVLFEFAGYTTFDQSDSKAITPGSATAATGSGTGATTSANEIAVAVIGLSNTHNAASGPATAWSNGWTNYAYVYSGDSTGITAIEMMVALKVLTSTGVQTTTATLTKVTQPINTSNGLMATYK